MYEPGLIIFVAVVIAFICLLVIAKSYKVIAKNLPITTIEKSSISPSDYIIVRLERNLSKYELEKIHTIMRYSFPRNKVIFLDRGIFMSITSPDDD